MTRAAGEVAGEVVAGGRPGVPGRAGRAAGAVVSAVWAARALVALRWGRPVPPAPPGRGGRRGVLAVLAVTRRPCLVRARVLQVHDAARGRPRDLCVGVRRGPGGRLVFHAWLDGDPDGAGFAVLERRPPPEAPGAA